MFCHSSGAMKGKSTGLPPSPVRLRWWRYFLVVYPQLFPLSSGIPFLPPKEYRSSTITLALRSIFAQGWLDWRFNLQGQKESCHIRSRLREGYVNEATRAAISFFFELVFAWEEIDFTVEGSVFQFIPPLNKFFFVSDWLLDFYNILAVFCFFHAVVGKTRMVYFEQFILIFSWLWFFINCSPHYHQTIITFIIS